MRYKIGLDLGIASIGWAVMQVNENGEPIKIEKLGTRIFEKAENPKDGSSLATRRREARGVRRRLRRREHRRDRVLSLLEKSGIITKSEVKDMYNSNYRFDKNVYELRVEGLDKPLTNREMARVLISFVKRRGYKSNSKSEVLDKEAGKLLTATSENSSIIKKNNYRTVAEMYLKDERFSYVLPNSRKIIKIRNTTNDYKSTVLREDLLNEINLILNKQKEFNYKITDDFIEKYLNIFESQRAFDEGPGGDSIYGGNQIEKILGRCTFEKKEPRAMKATYTFEYFKFLQDINHIKLEIRENTECGIKQRKESLSSSQREKMLKLAKKSDSINFAKIRKELELDYNTTFNMVRYKYEKNKTDEEIINESEKNTKIKTFESYHKIRKVLDKIEKGLIEKISHDELDNIGYALSVYKNDEKRIEYLTQNTDLSDEIIDKLLVLSFSKSGNLSIKAMKKIIPFLEKGITYDKAVESVPEYNFNNISTKRKVKLSFNNLEEEIQNPVVKRAVSQTIKVINAIIDKYGSPDSINIELARELSKTFKERTEIDNRNNERKNNNEKVKKQIEELGKNNVTGQDIIKYKLWMEQDGVCMYSGNRISVEDIFSELVDVDHIIPYSICFDDSYNNKVLVLASENRQKGNRVPLEYFTQENKSINDFITRVEHTYKIRGRTSKLKKMLIESISREDIKGFKERNLKDSQYLSRVVHNLIRNNLEFNKNDNIKVKVNVVNGSVTSHIRKRLGIEKIRSNGDEHHAIDAVVISTVTPKLIQDITRFYQRQENKYIRKKDNFIDRETGEIISINDLAQIEEKYFPEPYPNFRKELEIRTMQNLELMHLALKKSNLVRYEDIDSVKPIFVSRMPKRKVKGAAHKDTIRGLKKVEKGYVSVTKTNLTKLKVINKNGIREIEGYPDKQKRDDVYLYKGLLDRLEQYNDNAKEAFKEPFYRPDKYGIPGPLVKKVKIENKISSFVELNGGKALAENGSMIRIDIFFVENEGYYFIPIYTADVLKDELPKRACVANKSMEEWKEMDNKNFIFSLYPNDLVYIKSNGKINLKPYNNKELKPIEVSEIYGYYIKAGISNGAIVLSTHNNKYIIENIGIKRLEEMKKYQVDILGEYHEVRLPEKRMNFDNMKGGKA